jgi:hypothetical protein
VAVASTAALVLGVVNVIGAANTLQMANQARHNGGSSSSPDIKEAANQGPSSSSGGTETGKWNQGSFKSPEESLVKHFEKHGAEVGAKDAAQYLRKAEAFTQNLRGAERSPVEGFVEGVVRYAKNGRYVDLAPDGTIVSFGAR